MRGGSGENGPSLAHAAQELRFIGERLGHERLHVGLRRSVPGVGTATKISARRKRTETADRLGIEQSTARGNAIHRKFEAERFSRRPSIDVSAYPARISKLAQPPIVSAGQPPKTA